MRTGFRMMLVLLAIWPASAILAGTTGPVELPPDDFTAPQYIDSAGCVYRRQGAVWAPRLDSAGAVICGFPPSLPGHAAAGDEIEAASPALRLSVTLAEGLQNGDVIGSTDENLRRTPVATPQPRSGELAELGRAMDAIPAMRSAAAGQPAGGKQLCELLGYETASAGGGGATLGICAAGGGAMLPAQVVTAAAPTEGRTGRSRDEKVQVTAVSSRPRMPVAGANASGSADRKPDQRKMPAEPRAPSTVAAGPAIEMVPAGARYIQVGRFPIPADADAAIRHLSGMGYPVVRGVGDRADVGGRLVMAGPFADRRAVIAALDHLRATSYPKATAR